MELSRKSLYALSLGMTVVFTFGGWLYITYLTDHTILEALARGFPLWKQLAVGAAIGVVVGVALSVAVFTIPWLEALRVKAQIVVNAIQPRWYDLVVLSLAAGWGEEILFRGALQPVVGIWIASLLFAAAHGMLNFRSKGQIAYTAFLFLAGFGLGLVYEWAGLVASMTLHAVYDFAGLTTLVFFTNRQGKDGEDDVGDEEGEGTAP